MKKIAMIMAAAAIAVSANAQRTVITASKVLDNTYVGVNGGATSYLYNVNDVKAMSAWSPNFGIRLGKNFTTVFGLALDANINMNAHKADCDYNLKMGKTFINRLDLDLLGTANLMNLFAGYKGQPRPFEVIAVGGFGWSTGFGFDSKQNGINSKVGLDFAYNFGSDKQWQVYVEPSLVYQLQNYGGEFTGENFQYNLRNSEINFKAGVNYKFKCSNGHHNFAVEQLRDQSEIDGLNAQINSLRGDLDAANKAKAAADAKAADLQKKLNDCLNKPVPVVEKKAANLQPSVVFAQGKSVVRNSQMANIEMIAKYMQNNKDAKVKISGYASPEGPKELNQKLSEKRAVAVKDVLVKKYKISADRLETEGLGATDKLFDQVEFNRVALFNDTTK